MPEIRSEAERVVHLRMVHLFDQFSARIGSRLEDMLKAIQDAERDVGRQAKTRDAADA